MQIQSVRTLRVQAASTPASAKPAAAAPKLAVLARPSGLAVMGLERPALTDVQTFMGHVVKVVAYGQERQAELERVGRAFNAGTATEAEFNAASGGFQEVVDELRALQKEGKRFNAPWWRFGGWKVDKFYETSGAMALLTYRPPTLNKPEPSKPEYNFDELVAAAERAAKDGVDVKDLLTKAASAASTVPQLVRLAAVSNMAGDDVKFTGGLFERAIKQAGSVAELKLVLDEAAKGDTLKDAYGYPKADSRAYEHVQRAAISKAAGMAKTQADHLAVAEWGRAYVDDPAFTTPLLLKALEKASTRAELDAVLAIARQGDHVRNPHFKTSVYYDFDSRAYADVQRAAFTRLAATAATTAELLAVAELSVKDLDDPAFTEPLLMKALEKASTPAEIDAVLAIARKGDSAKDPAFKTIEVYTFDVRAYADVQRAAITRLAEAATTQAERVRVADLGVTDLDDVPFTRRLLMTALGSAQQRAEIEAVLAVARKGDLVRDPNYSSLVFYNHDAAAYKDVLTAGHRRIDALELKASVPETTAEVRVKFLLQPVPVLAEADAYRGYTTKALAYLLMDLDDVKAARAAFKAGTLPKSALLDAEERLELSKQLVEALHQQATPGRIADWRAQGFDAAEFWARYPVAQLEKDVLGQAQ